MRLSRRATMGVVGSAMALSVSLATVPAFGLTPMATPKPTPSASASAPSVASASDARAQVDKLRAEQQAVEGRAADIEKRLSDTSDRIDEKERDIAVAEKKIKETEARLAEIALQRYRDRDSDSAAALFISSGDTESFLSALSTAENVAESNTALLSEHEAAKATLMDDKRILDSERAQAQKDFKELEKLRAEIQAKVQAAQGLYNNLDSADRAKYFTNGQYNGTSRDMSRLDAPVGDTPLPSGQLPSGYRPGGGSQINVFPRPSVPSKYFGPYAFGNCTYYVYARRASLGRPVQRGWGDARMWPSRAAAAGYRVDRTPEPGAVYVTFEGQWGHVMVVEQILPRGEFVVSEMNYAGGFNRVSTRVISGVGGVFIH